MDPLSQITGELVRSRPTWRLRWLGADERLARSRGPIANPQGLNRRMRKPERGGLLCCRIFGPVEDLSCICTKYQGDVHRGITCEKCGVDVREVAVRRERFGHIELPDGLVHPWDEDRRIESILVLPAGLREQPPDDTRDDLRGLNGLYQRVVRCVAQLARCVEYCAPTLVVEHETDRAQQALDRLVGAPRRRPGTGPTLSDYLQRAMMGLDDQPETSAELIVVLAAVGLTVADGR